MGGITAPLHINGTILGELNLSSDAPAALCVLQNGKNRLISTGNACMTAFFPREQAEKRLRGGGETGAWLLKRISYWFQRERAVFGHDGIYQWDVCAAAALMEPEWFDWQETVISPTVDSLRSGNLIGGGTAVTVWIPSVRDESAFTEHIYDVYLKNKFKGGELTK